MAGLALQVQPLPLQRMNKSIQTLKPQYLTNMEKILESNYYINLVKEKRNPRSQRLAHAQGKIINLKMRNRVVKWLKEISQETFQFNTSTLYTAIQILDQYLLLSNQHYSQLQLIAATALFMGSKLSQKNIVAGQCYVQCADELFTKQDLEQKELLMYEVLGFNLDFPNPVRMIHGFAKDFNLNKDSLKEGQQFLVQNLIGNGNTGHHYLDIASTVVLCMMERSLNEEFFSKKLNQLVFV